MYHVIETEEWYADITPLGDAPPMEPEQFEALVDDGKIYHCHFDDVTEITVGKHVYRVQITTDGAWLEVTECSGADAKGVA